MRRSSKSGSRRRRPRAIALASDSITFTKQYAVAFMLPGYTGEEIKKMQDGGGSLDESPWFVGRAWLWTERRQEQWGRLCGQCDPCRQGELKSCTPPRGTGRPQAA